MNEPHEAFFGGRRVGGKSIKLSSPPGLKGGKTRAKEGALILESTTSGTVLEAQDAGQVLS